MKFQSRPTYIDDITGKPIESFDLPDVPSCIINFDLGYGSNHDGLIRELHFGPESAEQILNVLHREFPSLKLLPVKITR